MEGSDYLSALDFDETSNFLTAILRAVPSFREVPDWDNNELAISFIGSNGCNEEVSAEKSKHAQNLYENEHYSSMRLASYSELIELNLIASLEQSPTSTFLSFHDLPFSSKPVAFQKPVLEYQLSSLPEADTNTLLKLDTIPLVPDDDNANSNELRTEKSPNLQNKHMRPDEELKEDKKADKKTRRSHRVIEKNYRCNINSKINELRDAVPTLKIATGKTVLLIADLEGLVPASKLNKASVLSKAVEYIKHLQLKNDSLRDKIARLQALVGSACVNGIHNRAAVKTERSDSFESHPDLSFDFDDRNMALMYVSKSMAPENAAEAYPTRYSQSRGSNMMIGGLAVVMGSSFINDDAFHGMAATPVSGSYLCASTAASQLIAVLRYLVMGVGILMILEPMWHMFSATKEKIKTHSSLLAWVLVSCGLYPPLPLLLQDKEAICDRLVGKRKTKLSQMFKDYVLLSSSEFTFENCLLTVLLGTVIVRRISAISAVLSVSLRKRGALLFSLKYEGENENLRQLARMIQTLDGLNMFESHNLVQRFVNLSTQTPICTNISSDENEMTYVDFYLRNRDEVFHVLYSWRVLELIHELNLVYIELLCAQADEKSDAMVSLCNDIQKLEDFIGTLGALWIHLLLFKAVVSSEAVPSLMKMFEQNIQQYLTKLEAISDGPEFTDEEFEFEGDGSSLTLEKPSHDQIKTLVRQIDANESIIYSLNIIDEEKMVALVASALGYYLYKELRLDLLRLLQLLEFKDPNQPISLFMLTCFVKLLCLIIKSDEEDQNQSWTTLNPESCEVLELLVKHTRSWLIDSNKKHCLSQRFRTNLSDLVVKKGIALNSI